MKTWSGRFRKVLLMSQVITLSPLIVQGQNDDISLDEAIRREIARPAPDSLKLPEPAGEAVPQLPP